MESILLVVYIGDGGLVIGFLDNSIMWLGY